MATAIIMLTPTARQHKVLIHANLVTVITEGQWAAGAECRPAILVMGHIERPDVVYSWGFQEPHWMPTTAEQHMPPFDILVCFCLHITVCTCPELCDRWFGKPHFSVDRECHVTAYSCNENGKLDTCNTSQHDITYNTKAILVFRFSSNIFSYPLLKSFIFYIFSHILLFFL